MKKFRPFIYLFIALVAAFVVFMFERPEVPRVNDSSSAYFIPDLDTSKIARVEIEQLIDGVNLKRDGDNWKVAMRTTEARKSLEEKEGAAKAPEVWRRADTSRVNGAIGTLNGLEQGVMVSDNPGKQSLYQVNLMGVHVKGYDASDKPVFDVIIGKNGPDFASSYVRKADENKVYLIHRNLMGFFSSRMDDWREKGLWQLEPNDIKEVEVRSAKGKWRMAKDENNEWKVAEPEGKAPDQEKLRGLVSKLSTVRAEGFADETGAKTTGLDAPSLSVNVKYGRDKTAELLVGNAKAQPVEAAKKGSKEKPKTPDRYYGKLGGDEEVYLLTKEFVESIPNQPPE